jgi:amino acid adenylation domain-containing protein
MTNLFDARRDPVMMSLSLPSKVRDEPIQPLADWTIIAHDASTLRDLIDRLAAAQPEVTFLIDPDSEETVSFGVLRRQLTILSARLREFGLQSGDKIALLLNNGLFPAQLFLGAMYSGMVSVPLNVGAGVSHLAFMLDHSDAKVVFVGDEYLPLIAEVQSQIHRPIEVIPADRNIVSNRADAVLLTPISELPKPEDPALLMYTSGSTGRPKAAVHSHRTILAAARNSIHSHQLSPTDRSLLVLPLYHINAECVTLVPTLMSGGSVVIPRRFNVSQFWDWLGKYRCTWSAVVPTIISQLLDWQDPHADRRQDTFKRIKFLRSSSAPLAPSLHREFLARFPLLLIQAMGSSEAGNVFSNPLPPGENKIGSPGLPWGFETKVINHDGKELQAGEAGEVVLRGPAIMRGYYKDEEGTAAVLDPDGWLHTGDLAYRDQDGYFFVVGRSKELIIKGGVNIAPRQIDDVLESHPSVLEAATIGVPDHHLGEDVVAVVVLRAGHSADEKSLLAFCENRLGAFKTPTRIHFTTSLPKGPSGKVQRLRLRENLEQGSFTVLLTGEATTTQHSLSRRDGMPSTSSVEKSIADCWTEVLSRESIDPNSNFFALGGHSLLAVQCISRLREKLSVTLSLSDFFRNGTIAKQAALIMQRLLVSARNMSQTLDPAGASTGENLTSDDAPPDTLSRILPRDRAVPCPLSPAQKRLWFMEQLNPGLPVYNESEAVRLVGDLNCQAVEMAMQIVVSRHEVLRTTIELSDKEPVAVVNEAWRPQVKTIDLSALEPLKQQVEVERLLVDEPRRLYHLESEPGIRLTLLRLGSQEHVLLLMMHHIVCDWASEGVLWREFASAYRALSLNEPVILPAMPIQHGDYSAWKVEQTAASSFDEDLAYWQETLSGAPELLELPADRPRPAVLSHRGARQRLWLNPLLTAALRELSQRMETTLFTTLAAVLNVLLYRYTGKEDLLLGIPIADRDLPEMQPLIGFLLHTQVLRTKLSAAMTFRELLSHVQDEVLGLYLHRAVPFDLVVNKIRPKRSVSYSPLFQIMLNWRDRDQMLSVIGLEGLKVESLLSESRTSKFDLLLFATDFGDQISLEMEYSTDLFNEDRIRRMLGHYQVLLESVVANPDLSLNEIPILTDRERQQLLIEWNRTGHSYIKDLRVHELIEGQAERTPDSVALIFEDAHLTYRELNERSSHLARHLLALGVGPHCHIGICVERSLEMVVGIIGILKTGGAYLPLDPAYPRERLALMINDARPPLVLTQTKLRAQLPAEVPVVYIDRPFDGNHKVSVVDRPDAGDLAYVLYTSGSTGEPKGVQISHRSLVNFLISMRREPGLTANDTLLAVTTLSFDISALELFLPLTCGARLVLASADATKDGKQLSDLMQRWEVSVMQATPATWRLLLDSKWTGSQRLKILCGGEPWPVELADELLPRCQSLWNMYGPTETTIWSSVHKVEKGQQVLIGPPIANTTFYVLDANNQLLPIGVPGELYIGGDGLAKGYLGRPALTEERFLGDPFSPFPESKLYRTGDRVRRLRDGRIEFIGRLDNQIKLRGFRIELGEIEFSLNQHPGVKQCVLAVRRNDHAEVRLGGNTMPKDRGDGILVAYFESVGVTPPTAAELRAHLKKVLPDFMIPSVFIRMDRLPLTHNGKIDRSALPRPGERQAESLREFTPPRDAIEKMLVEVWEKTLKLKQIGVHDNFFELGGHSLAAVRMMSEIRSLTGKGLPLATLFQSSTVAALAEIIRGDAPMPTASSLVPIRPQGSKSPVFLVHGAEGNVLLYRDVAEYIKSDHPVYGLQARALNGGRLTDRTTVQEMAAGYIEDIRSVQPHGPYLLGGYCFGGVVAFEMAQQLTARGQRVELVFMLETYNLNTISRNALRLLAPLNLAQNIGFHFANFLDARGKGSTKFLNQKLDTVLDRLAIRLRHTFHRLQQIAGRATHEVYPHFMVKKANEYAGFHYAPRPYDGRVVLIRPKRYFAGRGNPSMGWSEVVTSGIEIRHLPIYPKGMLVEPFCRQLAETISSCL